MSEEWRTIPDFPDYAISNLGRVKRLTPQKGTWPGKILKARMGGEHNGNYFQVRIPDCNGKYTGLSVSRLVAKAFIPNPRNKPEVNHVDGDKSNNAKSNLEWATHLENSEHAARTGLMARGSHAGQSKLVEENIPIIRKLRSSGHTFQSIADKFGVSVWCAMDVVHGRTWSHV